jgi:hypothetical protein
MESKQHEYKGHRIEIRALSAEDVTQLELLVDGDSVPFGQHPDGAYSARDYAYDYSDSLVELGQKLIDRREAFAKSLRAHDQGRDR